MPTTQVYRNCLYYLVSASATKVWFEGHHSRNGDYKTIGECPVENWLSGDLYARNDA